MKPIISYEEYYEFELYNTTYYTPIVDGPTNGFIIIPPILPNGLIFNTITGVIGGNVLEIFINKTYEIFAYNNIGQSNVFKITISSRSSGIIYLFRM